jgi:Holliday junction resolvase
MVKVKALKVTEKAFQQTVLKTLKVAGYHTYHTWNSMHSTKGFPDIIAINPKRKLIRAIEIKTDTGKLTEEQNEWLALFRLVGVQAEVLRPSKFDEWWETIRP